MTATPAEIEIEAAAAAVAAAEPMLPLSIQDSQEDECMLCAYPLPIN